MFKDIDIQLFGSSSGKVKSYAARIAPEFSGQSGLNTANQGFANTSMGYAAPALENANNMQTAVNNGQLTDPFKAQLTENINNNIGGLLSGLNGRGVINSSTFGTGMQGVTKQANADNLNYLNFQGNQAQQTYNQGMGYAQPSQDIWSKLFSGQLGLSSPNENVSTQGNGGKGALGTILGAAIGKM